jgi:hypothetical protein
MIFLDQQKSSPGQNIEQGTPINEYRNEADINPRIQHSLILACLPARQVRYSTPPLNRGYHFHSFGDCDRSIPKIHLRPKPT